MSGTPAMPAMASMMSIDSARARMPGSPVTTGSTLFRKAGRELRYFWGSFEKAFVRETRPEICYTRGACK